MAAAIRRLEVRIGQLLGPATNGVNQHSPEGSFAKEPSLNKDQRHQFRQMAEHPEVVEEVIAESTDEKPGPDSV